MRKTIILVATLAVLTASSASSPATAVPTEYESQEYPPYDLFFPRRENATSVVVRVHDELYGVGVAYRACFADADTLSCGDVPYRCGGSSGHLGDGTGDGILVQLLPLLIQNDLSVCGALTGTVSVDWFNPSTS